MLWSWAFQWGSPWGLTCFWSQHQVAIRWNAVFVCSALASFQRLLLSGSKNPEILHGIIQNGNVGTWKYKFQKQCVPTYTHLLYTVHGFTAKVMSADIDAAVSLQIRGSVTESQVWGLQYNAHDRIHSSCGMHATLSFSPVCDVTVCLNIGLLQLAVFREGEPQQCCRRGCSSSLAGGKYRCVHAFGFYCLSRCCGCYSYVTALVYMWNSKASLAGLSCHMPLITIFI